MADITTLTREGLALTLWERIAGHESLWNSRMSLTEGPDRTAALDLLAEVLRTLDGKRPLP
jgi:hypothetical protein